MNTKIKNNNKRHSFLLFKQAFKQALRNKTQLIGLAFLVFLSSTIFSLMQTSISRINQEYSSLISSSSSNIHDFIVDPVNTVVKTNATDPQTPVPSKPDTPVTDDWQLDNWQRYLNDYSSNNFIFDRVEARTLMLNNNNDPKVLKIVTNNWGKYRNRVDRLVITHGYNIGANDKELTPTEKQAVINKEFAERNNLNIGDVIRVQQDRLGDSLKVNYDINNPEYSTFAWLKIVGFGISADFMTPIIDRSTPLPNKTKESIVYVDPQQFGLYPEKVNSNNYKNNFWFYSPKLETIQAQSQSDKEVYYVGKFNDKSNLTKNDRLNNLRRKIKEVFINQKNSDNKLVYLLGDSDYRFNSRTSTLPSTIHNSILLLSGLLIIVLFVTGLTIILVTIKNVDNSKPQFGVLKSLGYSNWKILITSLAYPMIAALLGTAFVFFPASGLQILVLKSFASYFNLNFGPFKLNAIGYLYCLILTFGFLSIIAWVISAIAITKKPIVLLKNDSVIQNSRVGRFITKLTSRRKFLTRFRIALFTSSVGKMTAVAMTMFLGTSLMTTAVIGPKIMSDNTRLTYNGMDYKSLTEYMIPSYNSPFSFYKTYNPYDKPWDYTSSGTPGVNQYTYPDRYNNKGYVKDLLRNSINSEAYAPIAPNPESSDPISDLNTYGFTFLGNKMLTKSFLKGLENSSSDPILFGLITQLAWPQAKDIYNIVQEDQRKKDLYDSSNYDIIRKFYLSYRSTILMSVNNQFYKSDPNRKKLINNSEFENFMEKNESAAWKEHETDFQGELNNYEFDPSDSKFPLHSKSDKEFLKYSSSNQIAEPKRKELIREGLIWYFSIFYNRIGQAVAQGAYSQAPYFIRQNIASAYENQDKQFNISFNTIPFIKDKDNSPVDELGTYLNGNFKDKNNYAFKIYGLQSQAQLGRPSFMQLYDNHGNILNPRLEEKNNNPAIKNVVINQTIAKKLNWKVNQVYDIDINRSSLAKKEGNSGFSEINTDKIKFENITNYGDSVYNQEYINNANLLNQKTNIDDINEGQGTYWNNGPIAPSPMTKAVKSGNVTIKRDTEQHRFKVVGIYNGYGQPAAYISKTNADNLLKYDEAKAMLYRAFWEEWRNKNKIENIDFPRLNAKVGENHKYKDYEKFQNGIKDQVLDPQLNTMFENEYPIFNFKFSRDESLPDLTTGYSVTQPYGDYSGLGMNGGKALTDNNSFDRLADSSVSFLLPMNAYQQVLKQLTDLINTILLFFIIFALLISFFVILLTSDLIIYENRKVIATMKTLGYSDLKITNIVIGMYLPIIVFMFAIGLPSGWFIISYIVNYIAFHSSWVLPLIFTWWIPFTVAFVVLAIYVATFAIEWNAMKKIRPLDILS